MTHKTEKRMNLWLIWNYEEEQEKLDRLSEQGLHLSHPNLFRSIFTRDDAVRYTYRLDFQPGFQRWLGKKSQFAEYISLYEDAGWENVGRCNQWYFFRRPWVEGNSFELYTDRESIRQHYQKLKRLMGTFLVLELCYLIICIFSLRSSSPHNHSYLLTPIVLLFGLVVTLLGYGYFRFHQKAKRL